MLLAKQLVGQMKQKSALIVSTSLSHPTLTTLLTSEVEDGALVFCNVITVLLFEEEGTRA